jgi:hypothetical protein
MTTPIKIVSVCTLCWMIILILVEIFSKKIKTQKCRGSHSQLAASFVVNPKAVIGSPVYQTVMKIICNF